MGTGDEGIRVIRLLCGRCPVPVGYFTHSRKITGGWPRKARPVPQVGGRFALRRDPRPVPPDLPESGRPQRLLVGLDAEVVVLQPDGGAVLQVERPGDRRPLHEFALDARLEPVLPVRRGAAEVECGVRVDRDEPPARLEAAGDPPAHRPEFRPVPGVVQQVGGDGQVEFRRQGVAAHVLHEVVDARGVFRLLGTGQGDHRTGQVDADDPLGPLSPEASGIEPFAAGQVHDRLAREVADQAHQGEGLDGGAPGLSFGPPVLGGDGVVVGEHRGPGHSM